MSTCFVTCFAIFIIGFIGKTTIGVKINKLQVPEVIKHGDPVVLDCDFTLEASDEDLVVKWFFNKKNPTLVYQWIPGSSKRPQDLGILKGRLNLEYVASMDANSVHRALHILKPDPDLSGDYTCVVSTFQSEDIQTKNMIVFAPEKKLMLRSVYSTKEFTKVLCSADGVFPRPDMVLRLPKLERNLDSQIDIREEGRLFDVTATVIIPTPLDPLEISCELRIPQANYTKLQETVIFPGNSTNKVEPSSFFILYWAGSLLILKLITSWNTITS